MLRALQRAEGHAACQYKAIFRKMWRHSEFPQLRPHTAPKHLEQGLCIHEASLVARTLQQQRPLQQQDPSAHKTG